MGAKKGKKTKVKSKFYYDKDFNQLIKTVFSINDSVKKHSVCAEEIFEDYGFYDEYCAAFLEGYAAGHNVDVMDLYNAIFPFLNEK